MTDFRVNKIRNVATSLGFKETFYDEDDKVLAYSNGFFFKFTDKDIVINADCLEISPEKKAMVSAFCEMINPKFSPVVFTVYQGHLFGVCAISNTVFMREDSDSELKADVESILDKILSAVGHVLKLMKD